jgi:hypothetical protein
LIMDYILLDQLLIDHCRNSELLVLQFPLKMPM